MKIIEQLAAKYQIKLAAKMVDALLDVRRLHGKVFFVVKTDFFHNLPPAFYKFVHTVYCNEISEFLQ